MTIPGGIRGAATRANGSRARAFRAVMPVAFLALAGMACDGCLGCDHRGAVLATLQAMSPTGVERDHAGEVGRWRAAKVGGEYRIGDGVRTGTDAGAHLALADGNTLDLPERTLVRFMSDGEGQGSQHIEVEAGSAVLSAGAGPLHLVTRLGMAVLQPGGRLRVARDSDAVRYTVELGRARFSTPDGAIEARVGEAYEIGIGEAVLRRVGDPVADAGTAVAAARTTTAETTRVDAGDAALDERDGEAEQDEGDDDDEPPGGSGDADYVAGLPSASMRMSLGRSATVHAPSVPIAVSFDLGKRCRDEGLVQVERGGPWYRGRGSVAVPVGAGLHRYRIRCLTNGKPGRRLVGRGRLQVLRDAGTRRLPRKPPTSHIDADGRSYQVHYQNQRPTIVVRWPRAPESARYELHVDDGMERISRPEHTFRSGSLSDGRHRLYFAAGGRRSRETTLVVRFDNAAATASLSSPEDGSFAVGDTVSVAGVLLPGWKVSAEGGTLQVEDGYRFRGQVTTSSERPDVALKLSHPRLGTHYYLRRASRPP